MNSATPSSLPNAKRTYGSSRRGISDEQKRRWAVVPPDKQRPPPLTFGFSLSHGMKAGLSCPIIHSMLTQCFGLGFSMLMSLSAAGRIPLGDEHNNQKKESESISAL